MRMQVKRALKWVWANRKIEYTALTIIVGAVEELVRLLAAGHP